MDDSYISRLKGTRPSLPENTISRKALEQKVGNFSQQGFVLVTGPAGYGKTTFISNWLQDGSISNNWFRIDDEDNDPSQFCWGLFSSLQRTGKDLSSLRNILKGGWHPSGITPIINSLSEILENPEKPFALVLDDYHKIKNPFIHRFIEDLIHQNLNNTLFFLSSRNEPPFALGSLRLNNMILEITQRELAFSLSESEEFLGLFKQVELSIDEIQVLHEKTEGWPAGLGLSMYALGRTQNHAEWIDTLHGSEGEIADFILNEVFRDQSEETKDFLLRSSIMERFSADLCNFALKSEKSAEHIAYLLENNIFIEKSAREEEWFRYHNLFADFLSKKSRQLNRVDINNLMIRAAQWYLKSGSWRNALDYFFKAEDSKNFLDVIREHIEELFIFGWYTLIKKWLDALPEEILSNEFEIQVYLALSNIMLGERDTGKKILEKLEMIISQEDPKLQYMVRCGNIYLAYFDHEIEKMLKLAEQMIEDYPPGLASWHAGVKLILARGETIMGKISQSNTHLKAIISFSIKENLPLLHLTAAIQLAINYIHQGDLEYAALTCSKYIRNNIWERFPLTAILYAILGDIYREKNELDKALEHILIARNKIEKVGGIGAVGWIEQAYFRIQLALGKYDICDQILDDYDLELHKSDAPVWLWDSLNANRMILFLKQNKLWRLEDFCVEKQAMFSQHTSFSNFQSQLQYSRFLLVKGKSRKDQDSLDEAKKVINSLTTLASESNWMDLLLQCEIMNMTWESVNGNVNRAIDALEKAVKIGSRGGYVRIFLDDWDAIRGLIRQGSVQSKSFGYLEKISAMAKENGNYLQRNESSFLIRESLTRQEMKILASLESVYSIPEIAEQLSLAPSTVRTHVKHIFSKLGVHSRMEAVITARNLNLL